MSRLVYVGPYAECTHGKPKTTSRKARGCTNPKCKRCPQDRKYTLPDDSGKFCAACGSAIGKVVVRETYYPEPYEFVGDALDRVQSDGERGEDVVFLAPNERRKGDPRPEGLNAVENIHLDLGQIDRAAEMAWFE